MRYSHSRSRSENGFVYVERSAENGFTPLRRSAENGFTPLRRSAENGFTLVELMVVIVILGLLVTIVAINVLPSLGKANEQKAKADIATLDQALELYRLNHLTYPSATDGLGALLGPGASASGAAPGGGFIKKLPKDPWGQEYRYLNPGQHGPYDVYSLGADNAPGGTGENADIGNWQ